ncbi:MAG: hypothetical protein ACUVX9_17750 [Anaerolineae bacterium]
MVERLDLIQWLLNEGGPSIRYRTAMELMDRPSPADGEPLAATLLQTDAVRWLLAQMDGFGPITHVDIRVLNDLHGSKPACLENVVPRLLERGLRAGITAFDSRMERFRQYVDDPLVQAALDDPDQATVEQGRVLFIAIVLPSYFLRGGYRHDEVMALVERRLEAIARIAAERNYGIHLREDELGGLPKQWAGKPIIRLEMAPTTGTKPLPLVHDLFAFAYLPQERLSEATRRKLDQIVTYVQDERYRALPWGYGYLWSKANRTCHGCGWNLDLPDLGSPSIHQQGKVVQRLELLARLPGGRDSAWFQEGLQLLESFRTERGTYRFPPAYLREMKAGYYIGGEYMGLEENRRQAQALELESTFRMLLLRKAASA